MQSQILWGTLLLAAGLVLTVLSVTVIPMFFLFYGIPMLVIRGSAVHLPGEGREYRRGPEMR